MDPRLQAGLEIQLEKRAQQEYDSSLSGVLGQYFKQAAADDERESSWDLEQRRKRDQRTAENRKRNQAQRAETSELKSQSKGGLRTGSMATASRTSGGKPIYGGTSREDLLKHIADNPGDKGAPIYLAQLDKSDRETAVRRRRTTTTAALRRRGGLSQNTEGTWPRRLAEGTYNVANAIRFPRQQSTKNAISRQLNRLKKVLDPRLQGPGRNKTTVTATARRSLADPSDSNDQ